MRDLGRDSWRHVGRAVGARMPTAFPPSAGPGPVEAESAQGGWGNPNSSTRRRRHRPSGCRATTFQTQFSRPREQFLSQEKAHCGSRCHSLLGITTCAVVSDSERPPPADAPGTLQVLQPRFAPGPPDLPTPCLRERASPFVLLSHLRTSYRWLYHHLPLPIPTAQSHPRPGTPVPA